LERLAARVRDQKDRDALEVHGMILFVVLVVTVALGTALVVGRWRRRMPADLDADWWPRFERDFRAYARRVSQQRADRHGSS
jgi:hypothetical protein